MSRREEDNEQCRKCLEEVPDWIWELDANLVITYSNRVVEDVLGYEASDLVGKSAFSLLPDEAVSEALRLAEEALHTLRPERNFFLEFRHKNGSVRIMHTCAVCLTDPTGTLRGFRAITRDVTDQAAANRAAANVLANYKALTENSQTGIIIVREGMLLYANPTIARIMGYTWDDMASVSLQILVHPDDLDRVRDYHTQRLRGEITAETCELRALTKSGEVRHFELRATETVYDGLPAILDDLVDITERKEAEEALHRSEEKYRRLVEDVSDTVWALDENAVYTYMNPSVTRIAGWDPQDIVGKTPFDFMTPEEAERVQKQLAEASTSRQKIGLIEAELMGKDGTTVIMESTMTPIVDREGKFRGFQGTSRDITERRRAEEQRLALERHLEGEKRRFYRETILSVTNGRLDVCQQADVRPYIAGARLRLDCRNAEQVAEARHATEAFCREHGMGSEELESFMVGVGEALTNAIKHAKEGRVYAGVHEGLLWVAVSDKGKGISSLILPRATLMRGFSTKPSLGLGYTIMLEVAGKILLKTGKTGTTVILVQRESEPAVEETLAHAW